MPNAASSRSENSTEEENESCSGMSCCVFPIILAFVLGAFLRQTFHWIRRQCYSGIPPYTVFILAIGAGFSFAADQGLLESYIVCLTVRGNTVLHVTLPLLVFAPTFNTEMQVFKKSLNHVLLIAVTGYGIVMLMTAMVVKLLFQSDWDYYTAIMFGVVVSATDPLAVEDAVKVSGVAVNLSALLLGESMIGDVVGMVFLRLIMLLLVLHLDRSRETGTVNWSGVTTEKVTLFVVEAIFAPFFGIVIAILTVFWLSRIYNDATLEITIVLSVVHLAYYISELLGMPGMVTVLFYGLYLSSSRASISQTVEATMKKSFQVLIDINNSVVYFYAGVFLARESLETFQTIELLHYFLLWLVVNVIRALMVFFLTPILMRLGLGMSWQHMVTVWISSLNGAFNILAGMMSADFLKMAFDTEISGKFYRCAMALLIMKQLFNTSSTRLLLRIFGLRSMPKFHQMSLANAMRLLEVNRAHTINALKSDRFMADAGFDIVESETEIDPMFKNFSQRRISVSKLFKKMQKPPVGHIQISDDAMSVETREDKIESIHMLIKTQKKVYWRHFERGLMSKEALHQLIDWADIAGDHKGRFLDTKNVKEASQVSPFLRVLKRQVKVKLRQLQFEAANARGCLYWQQQVLPKILGYGFHLIDTLLVFFAIVCQFVSFGDYLDNFFDAALLTWNSAVIGLYGMIGLGELLVMRLRFFKILWHNITLAIVLVGTVDLMLMIAMGSNTMVTSKEYVATVFVRLLFICSRLIRLLGLIDNVPCILKRMQRMLESRISDQLGVGYDICCAFVTGQVEVSRQVETFAQDANIVIDLKLYCNKSKLDIINTLGVLALEHPIIALSVKTRHAIRIVLNAQHDTVKELKMEGALQDSDAALLTKDLEERMKKLLTTPPLVKDDSEDSVIRNLGWIHGDEQLYEFIKENMEIWTCKPNAIITEQDNADRNIYVIWTGVAKLERMTKENFVSVVDYMTSGNVLGELNFLTSAPRFKTVQCQTAVKVLVLTEDMMELAVNRQWKADLPPLVYRMWLCIAKRVAIRVYMNDPEYQALSNEFLRMHLYNAYLVDDMNGTFISIHGDPHDDVILIHGAARDSFSRQPFQGPCFIPKTVYQLQLQPEQGLYPLVMIVPHDPHVLTDHTIRHIMHSTDIDHDILAMSGSLEALRLEDMFRKAQYTESRMQDAGAENSFDTVVSTSLSNISSTTPAQMLNSLVPDTEMYYSSPTVAKSRNMIHGAETHENMQEDGVDKADDKDEFLKKLQV